MAEPLTTAMTIASIVKLLGPAVASFLGKDKEVDVEEVMAMLNNYFTTQMDPAINAQARAGQVAGATIAQNMGTSAGRAGTGLRTGMGAAMRSIGNTVGNTRAINARGQGAAAVAQLVNQALPGVLEQKRQNANISSPLSELIAGLGQAEAATGQDPLQALLERLGFDTPEQSAANKKLKGERTRTQGFFNTNVGGGPTSPGSFNIQRPSMGGVQGNLRGGTTSF
jgi:hypothetical protein